MIKEWIHPLLCILQKILVSNRFQMQIYPWNHPKIRPKWRFLPFMIKIILFKFIRYHIHNDISKLRRKFINIHRVLTIILILAFIQEVIKIVYDKFREIPTLALLTVSTMET